MKHAQIVTVSSFYFWQLDFITGIMANVSHKNFLSLSFLIPSANNLLIKKISICSCTSPRPWGCCCWPWTWSCRRWSSKRFVICWIVSSDMLPTVALVNKSCSISRRALASSRAALASSLAALASSRAALASSLAAPKCSLSHRMVSRRSRIVSCKGALGKRRFE